VPRAGDIRGRAREEHDLPNSSARRFRDPRLIGRLAAGGAIAIAVLAVVLILFTGGSSYTVHAIFQNASQLVSGDQVEVAGNSIGSVSSISLTPDGQANVALNISNPTFRPLHEGTIATVRLASLSGIANRYVQLQLGPGSAPAIRPGGMIPPSDTNSAVDLDELFNTLNAPTRRALQTVIKGSAAQYAGRAAEARSAFEYLNPAVDATSMLFAEINHNTPAFTRLLVRSSQLLQDISTRQSDLSGLIDHLATTTEALGSQHVALGEAIHRLPGFQTLADTTFARLRTTLNDLTPLVNATRPVAPRLHSLLDQLEPLANNAVPTIHDLANIISRPGPDNDLIELTQLGRPLAAATVNMVHADGKLRPGAFPESTIALNDSTPELATDRPYAVDLTGWFEGFSHPGGQDANGGYSRVAPVVGVASLDNGLLNILPPFADAALRSVLAFGSGASQGLVVTAQGDRCPGSMERGGLYYPYPGYPCTPSEVPTGK
jgi:phospholipid/cholesterol/gamma-HCH transport system substrate-binding protein